MSNNNNNVVDVIPIAIASQNLKEVPESKRPPDGQNFVEANTTKKVKINNDDRDKGIDEK